jgi:hypothetical protein
MPAIQRADVSGEFIFTVAFTFACLCCGRPSEEKLRLNEDRLNGAQKKAATMVLECCHCMGKVAGKDALKMIITYVQRE